MMGKTKQLGAVSGETVLHTNDLIYCPAGAEAHVVRVCVCVDGGTACECCNHSSAGLSVLFHSRKPLRCASEDL